MSLFSSSNFSRLLIILIVVLFLNMFQIPVIGEVPSEITKPNEDTFFINNISTPTIEQSQSQLEIQKPGLDLIVYNKLSEIEKFSSLYKIHEIEIVEDYVNFVHVRASQDTLGILSKTDLIIQQLDNLNTLRFGQREFNTAENIDDLDDLFAPAWTTPVNSHGDVEQYYIVQFKGPIKNSWLDRIQELGAEILGIPVDHYAHLIKTVPSSIPTISKLEFVSWVDRYHPALKLRGGLELEIEKLPTSNELTNVEIIFFKSITLDDFYVHLDAVMNLGGLIHQFELDNNWWYSAKVTIPESKLAEVALLSEVYYIHPYGERSLRNDNARWVIQSFNATSKGTPVWDAGLHGEGVVVGMADTGIDYDHIMFRQNATTVGVPGPTHRKLVAYNPHFDDWDYEGNVDSGHGTHTSGSIVGDSLTTPGGYDLNDGMAYGAKLAFYDIVKSSNTWDTQYITVYFDDAYNVGARSHSDSWGDDLLTYTPRSERCDQYQWDHYDFLIFIAPGNGGKILEPATAKNIIGVGNAVNGDSKSLVGGSGKGPTIEGLISPTIIAPGGSIVSADSDGDNTTLNGGYLSMSGTSMATPVAAGATALVEQYFRDGFYPNGSKELNDSFNPSGPLKKAVIVNSGRDMFGGANINGHIPDNSQGWGKITLDDTLYFPGNTRRLWVEDRYNQSSGKAGLQTGNEEEYLFNLNSTEPFEVTVVWNDYPGAGLKNNLDLIVTDPDGLVYFGNRYINGQSAEGGITDTNNPIESVYFMNPKEGHYQVKVVGTNVGAGGSQNFAIVATGDFNSEGKGLVLLNSTKYGEGDYIGIIVLDSNSAGSGTVSVSVFSDLETAPEMVSLTESLKVPGKFEGDIQVVQGSAASDGKLQVNAEDEINVTYIDSSPVHISWAAASVDLAPPDITNSEIVKIDTESFMVYWETNEPATSEVHYGVSPGALHDSLVLPLLISDHAVEVTGLDSETVYYIELVSTDEVGNIGIFDNSGDYLTVITASYKITPDLLRVGWVQEGESYNHFDDGRIYTGVKSNLVRYGAIQFNLSGLPDDLKIFAGHLNLFCDSGSDLAPSGGSFYAEVLNSSIDELIKGTKLSPGFNNIKNTQVSEVLEPAPKVITTSTLREECWQAFEFEKDGLMDLEDRIFVNGTVTLRLRGPESKTGVDNMFSWDSGYNEANGSRGAFYRPQLVFWETKAPRISGSSPPAISFNEDTTDAVQVNLSRIFISNQPLDYSVPSHQDTEGTMLPGKNISVEVMPHGIVRFTPPPNWNGMEHFTFNGSIDSTSSHGGPGDLMDTQTYVLYELDVYVLPVNDPPDIASLGGKPAGTVLEFSVDQDEVFSEKMVVTDVDLQNEGDSHTFHSNSSLIVFSNLTDKLDTVEFAAGNDEIGTYTIKLVVRDSGGEDDAVVCKFTIINVNDAPVPIISEPVDGVSYNTSWPIVLNGSTSYDPDERFGDTITFEWLSDIEGVLSTEMILNKYIRTGGAHRITLRVTDSEFLFDAVAVIINVNKTAGFKNRDIDSDGMPNDWELEFGLDPYESIDQDEDPDGDDLTNYQEYIYDTDPFKADTDGDKHSDGEEVEKGTDPNNPKDYPGKSEEEKESLFVVIAAIFMAIVIAVTLFLFLRFKSMSDEMGKAKREEEDDDIEVKVISGTDRSRTIPVEKRIKRKEVKMKNEEEGETEEADESGEDEETIKD